MGMHINPPPPPPGCIIQRPAAGIRDGVLRLAGRPCTVPDRMEQLARDEARARGVSAILHPDRPGLFPTNSLGPR
jgi:hypothetical protein